MIVSYTSLIMDSAKEIKNCKDDMKMFTTRLFGGINKEDLDRMKTYCQIFEKNIRLMKEELDVQD